jgi:hypothetical protein
MAARHIIGILLSAVAVSAHAEFIILDPASVKPPAPVAAPEAPRQAVTPPVQRQPQFGVPQLQQRNVSAPFSSLRDNLRKITPQGWSAFIDKKINVEMPVELVASTDWKDSLRAMSNRYNIVFKIDEEKKALYVDQGPGGIRDLTQDNKNLATEQLPVKNLEVTTPDGKLRLEVKKGQRLSEALREFLSAGNWDLAWESGSDVVLEKPAEFVGTDIKEVMDQVLPNFRMYSIIHKGNNTVVVLPKTSASE